MLGVGMAALPTGIIEAEFIEELRAGEGGRDSDGRARRCPHCGEPTDPVG